MKKIREKFYRSLEGKLPAGTLHFSLFFEPPTSINSGYLKFTLYSAKNLDAKDYNGKSDPYCIVSLSGANKQKFKTKEIKNTLNPEWNYSETFVIERFEILVFKVKIYDWNLVMKHEFIGEVKILLADIPICETVYLDKPLLRPLLMKEASVKLGLNLFAQGLRAHYPVVIIPGLCSTALKVTETHRKSWAESRVWMDIFKVISQKLAKKRGDAIDIGNEWVEHMALMPDLVSDPPGIRVRPIKGKKGIDYLDHKIRGATYVMGPFIDQLESIGYIFGKSIHAAAYDWRLPPHALEERDQFFTELKIAIEQLSHNLHDRPVVLLCHSMGNRIAQYFLNWVKLHFGKEWISKYIHTFVAIGAPFLGSPKVVRGIVSGDRMGLDSLLKKDHGIRFARSLGSVLGLLPIKKNLTDIFVTQEGKTFEWDYKIVMSKAGAENMIDLYNKYYQSSNLFCSDQLLKAPPVENFVAIYGTDVPTECHYHYSIKKEKFVLSKSSKQLAQLEQDGYIVQKGIAYETKDTPQPCLKESTGICEKHSGDGTVPYASLSWCRRWEKDIPGKFKIHELPETEHREILVHQGFWLHITELIAK